METPDDFVIKKPPKNETADVITTIGLGTAACEAVKDGKQRGDCRDLLKPLEDGKADSIDVLVELLMKNPDEMQEVADRYNYNMDQAMQIVEKRLAAQK